MFAITINRYLIPFSEKQLSKIKREMSFSKVLSKNTAKKIFRGIAEFFADNYSLPDTYTENEELWKDYIDFINKSASKTEKEDILKNLHENKIDCILKKHKRLSNLFIRLHKKKLTENIAIILEQEDKDTTENKDWIKKIINQMDVEIVCWNNLHQRSGWKDLYNDFITSNKNKLHSLPKMK